jgi:hypothetical protein
MHGFTVFDNNAYKRLNASRLDRIIGAERSQGIVALASVAVLQELLARSRDTDADQRGRNRAAIRKLARHCGTLNGEKTVVNFIGHVESQVYLRVTGDRHPVNDVVFDRMGDAVRVITERSNDDPLDEMADLLSELEVGVASVESRYVASLEQASQTDMHPNQMHRNLDYAKSIIDRTATFYECTFSQQDIMQHLLDIAKLTSVGFFLRDSVVAEVRQKGGGYSQHANTVWDEEVVFATSMYTTISGKTLTLVTEESRLLEVGVSAGAAEHFVDIASYESQLGLERWQP